MTQAEPHRSFYEEKTWGTRPISPAKDLPNLKLARLLSASPKKGASLLEIGSGSGRILASVHQHRPDLRLTGVDISEPQLKLAQRDNPELTFLLSSGEHLPFNDGTFDFVYFLDVLEHVDHPDELMREAARILKRDGVLHFFCPAEGQGVYRLSQRVLGWHIKERTMGHIQQFTIRQIEELIAGQELTITNREYSYHLFGSIMDYTMFSILLNGHFAKLFWGRNKYYATTETKENVLSRLMNGVLSLANMIAYCESHYLRRVRLGANGIHLTARKR